MPWNPFVFYSQIQTNNRNTRIHITLVSIWELLQKFRLFCVEEGAYGQGRLQIKQENPNRSSSIIIDF